MGNEKIKNSSTHLLARLGWFCPGVEEHVKPYFTRLLRVLTFCLGVSKIAILKENGVVNGVVEEYNEYVKMRFSNECIDIKISMHGMMNQKEYIMTNSIKNNTFLED